MSETVHCDTHGETQKAYICIHLSGESFGLGFNCEEASKEAPCPDAWCDACEQIRSAHGGWTDEAAELTQIILICSECYERARIRNSRPSVTLDDLQSLRWQCGSCEEWHSGPMLDLSFARPFYWSSKWKEGKRWTVSRAGELKVKYPSFVDDDYCAIEDRDFFIRGIIHLPILGAAESFCWGVWGSVSRANFEILLKTEHDPRRSQQEPMFSWLSTRLPDYPDTLSLRMYLHQSAPGSRPHFRLERADHPLAQEYHHGMAPERVREIMFKHLPTVGQ